jgi:hypothetical protein
MSILACPESSGILVRLELTAGMLILVCRELSAWTAILVRLEPTGSAAARRHRGAQWVVLPRVDRTATTRTTAAGSWRTEASHHGMARMKAALTGWGCRRRWAVSSKSPLVETGTMASWSSLAGTWSYLAASWSSLAGAGWTAWWSPLAGTWSYLAASGMTGWWSPLAGSWSSLAATDMTACWSPAAALAAKDCRSPTQAETAARCYLHVARRHQEGRTPAVVPGIAPCCSRTGRPRRRTAPAGAARGRRGCSSTSRPPWRRRTRGAS